MTSFSNETKGTKVSQQTFEKVEPETYVPTLSAQITQPHYL